MKVKQIPRSIGKSLRLELMPKNSLGMNAKTTTTEVIISLTSISYRLPKVHLVIKSLLDQTVKFKKIILWLNRDLKNIIPDKLKCLESKQFEICFCNGNSPHRKLVETLKLYPEEYIVTCDDDMMYPKDWLERLLSDNKKHPNTIIAHMCRVFRCNNDGVLPYRTWDSEKPGHGSDLTLAVGWGGVLYPPNSLHADVLDEKLYMELAPKADDLWFKAMSLIKGTKVIKSSKPNPEPFPIIGTQKFSLKKENIGEDANREQWNKVSKFYRISLC